MLKKIIKFSIISIVILILIWAMVFIINFLRCMNYEPPILYSYVILDGYSCEYKCLGYSVYTIIENDRIIKSRFFWEKIKLFETDYR